MGAGGDGRDELAVQGRPPVDPSTRLKVSGPTRGWIPARGRNDGVNGVGRQGKCGVGGLVESRAIREPPLRGEGTRGPRSTLRSYPPRRICAVGRAGTRPAPTGGRKQVERVESVGYGIGAGGNLEYTGGTV